MRKKVHTKSFVVSWTQNGKEVQRLAQGKHQLSLVLTDAWSSGDRRKKVVVMQR